MILSIIGIVLGVIAIGLLIWLKKDQEMNNALYEGELEAAELYRDNDSFTIYNGEKYYEL